MQPADLNMTTTVTGHQLFLFVTFGGGTKDQELAEGLDLEARLALGAMESLRR